MNSKAQKNALIAQPLYKRAEAKMIERIINGMWSPGELLPNEFALAEEFGVSQGTIRKSLMSMERRGLLVRSSGRGTMVAHTTPEAALFAFFRLRNEDGSMVVPETIEETLTRRVATEEEAARLQPKCEEVYELCRTRHNKGRPLVMETMSFGTQLCEGMENDLPLPNSLYPYLHQRFGIAVMSAHESISAHVADEKIADKLSVDVGTPVLCIKRWANDLADRVVELRLSYYLTEFSSYHIDLHRADNEM